MTKIKILHGTTKTHHSQTNKLRKEKFILLRALLVEKFKGDACKSMITQDIRFA